MTPRSLLVLLRHGQTSWNATHRFQGQEDVPLDEVGIAQAAAAATVLGRRQVSRVIASDLSRATATAAPLAAALGLTVEVDARLREVDLGRWQGLNADEAAQAYPEEYRRWRQGEDVRRGGGETYVEVAARAVAAVREAQELNVDGLAMVAVTHGGTSRAIIGSLLGLEHPLWSSIGPLANGCWSTLVHLDTPDGVGRWRLLAHNSSAEPGGPGGVR